MTGAEDDIDNEDDNMRVPQECCMQLRRVSEECRCPMIRHAMKQMMQEAGYTGQECTGRCREAMMKGKFLPAMCNTEPHSSTKKKAEHILSYNSPTSEPPSNYVTPKTIQILFHNLTKHLHLGVTLNSACSPFVIALLLSPIPSTKIPPIYNNILKYSKMKLIVAVAFLTLVIAFAATAEEYSDTSCRQEMQHISLNRCRSFLKYGRRQSLLTTDVEDDIDDEEDMQAPQECCMQLRRVSEECRCPMIRHMMKQMKQEAGYMGQECTGKCREVMMKGKFLPAMCNMEPRSSTALRVTLYSACSPFVLSFKTNSPLQMLQFTSSLHQTKIQLSQAPHSTMKLVIAMAFFALVLALAATAEEYADTSCRQEMQRCSLNKCRSFFKSGRRQSLLMTGAEDDIDDEDDNMQVPQECCMQLRRVSEECRCPMIRHAMKQMMQEAGYTGQECTGRCREVMMKGKFLPAMCNMEPQSSTKKKAEHFLAYNSPTSKPPSNSVTPKTIQIPFYNLTKHIHLRVALNSACPPFVID